MQVSELCEYTCTQSVLLMRLLLCLLTVCRWNDYCIVAIKRLCEILGDERVSCEKALNLHQLMGDDLRARCFCLCTTVLQVYAGYWFAFLIILVRLFLCTTFSVRNVLISNIFLANERQFVGATAGANVYVAVARWLPLLRLDRLLGCHACSIARWIRRERGTNEFASRILWDQSVIVCKQNVRFMSDAREVWKAACQWSARANQPPSCAPLTKSLSSCALVRAYCFRLYKW